MRIGGKVQIMTGRYGRMGDREHGRGSSRKVHQGLRCSSVSALHTSVSCWW